MKHLKLYLAALLLAVAVIPVLVACSGGSGGDEGLGTATQATTEQPLIYGEILNDKTEFELMSADSLLALTVKGNVLFVSDLKTIASDISRGWNNPIAMTLPDQYAAGSTRSGFKWEYQGYMNYLPDNAQNGQYGLVFCFKDAKSNMTYDLFVTAHALSAGPFEFTGYLHNDGDTVDILPKSYFNTGVKGEDTPTVWTFKKESGIAEGYAGHDGQYFPGEGIYKTKLKTSTPIVADYNTFQDHNCNGYIPMVYVDYETHGFYLAHEWTNGKITASSGNFLGSCALQVTLGSDTFTTKVEKDSTFYFPTVYLGVYDGDVDQGSNVYKRWYINNKAPDILMKKKDEPLLQQDMQNGLDVPASIQSIKWDYGWWSRNYFSDEKGEWRKTNEGFIEVNAWSYCNVLKGYGAQTLADFVKMANNKGKTLALYILTKDTQIEGRADVPTSVGEYGHPEWFSDRNVTGAALSADFGNVDCVNFYKTYLLNFFKESGTTTWRTDFEPICFTSDKENRHYANGEDVQYWCSIGFYELVDYLQENLDYFRLEACSSGGAMKDFSTLRRAVVVNCDDSADFQSLKTTFYDSSYCIHPAQLMLPVNAGSYTPGDSKYVGYGDHDYGMMSQLLGAGMLSNHNGTQDADKEAWAKYLTIYNSRVKPLIKNGDLYHVFDRPNGTDWDGLFYVDTAASSSFKGMLAVFKPSSAAGDSTTVKLRGLEENKTYQVEFLDHKDQNVKMTGKQLMSFGLTVTFTEQFDSDWVFIKEVK